LIESLQTFLRQVRVRPRLTTCAVLASLCAFFLQTSLSTTTRSLIAWDIGAGLYIALSLQMMAQATFAHMRARAQALDEGAITVLLITLAAALASIAAIVIELSGLKSYPAETRGLHLALATFTIGCSWGFVHTIFAVHYAHEYYVDPPGMGEKNALQFPETPQPDYFDFLYFSFVIGTTSQTADVNIVSRTMRRLALLHGVVSFFFNATLLALTVNIAAGLL
jgi:uncharacterized membrane protein